MATVHPAHRESRVLWSLRLTWQCTGRAENLEDQMKCSHSVVVRTNNLGLEFGEEILQALFLELHVAPLLTADEVTCLKTQGMVEISYSTRCDCLNSNN